MTVDYRDEYERVLKDKHLLMEQIQVLSDALKETQKQLAIQRTINDALLAAKEACDD